MTSRCFRTSYDTFAANGSKPRYLIVGNVSKFGEIGSFFHENDMHLVTRHSSIPRTSYPKSTFLSDALKAAFKESIALLYSSGERRLSRKHFNALYEHAKKAAMAANLSYLQRLARGTSAITELVNIAPLHTESMTLAVGAYHLLP